MHLVSASIAAAIASALSLIALLPLLRRRVMDEPNHRSSHASPVPRAGGLAVVAGCVAGFVVASEMEGPGARILISLLVLAGLGFADDLRPQGVKLRFCVQLVAGVAVVSAMPPEAVLLWPLLVVFFVGQVNATNFMDGINGITALTVIVACVWFGSLGHSNDNALLTLSAATLGSATAAFAVWNLAGRVFLGDVGSYFIGGALASMALMAWSSGVDVLSCLAPLLVLIVDTVATLVRRIAAGQPVGAPHRDHVYQRLTQSGHSHVAVAALVATLGAVVCLLAAVSGAASWPWAVTAQLAAGLVLVGYLVLPVLADRDFRTEQV